MSHPGATSRPPPGGGAVWALAQGQAGALASGVHDRGDRAGLIPSHGARPLRNTLRSLALRAPASDVADQRLSSTSAGNEK